MNQTSKSSSLSIRRPARQGRRPSEAIQPHQNLEKNQQRQPANRNKELNTIQLGMTTRGTTRDLQTQPVVGKPAN
ncbi:hypothetical protein U1Q18_028291, partial [Sarracenia purpurea var. burkii]